MENETYPSEVVVSIPYKVFYTLFNILSLSVGVKNGHATISRMLGELLRNLTKGTATEPEINMTVQDSMTHITNLLVSLRKIPDAILQSGALDVCLRFTADTTTEEEDNRSFDGLDFGGFDIQ